MSNTLQYLFEVTLASSLLYLGFFLVKKQLSIQFRRFYLLACIVLPLLFPLLSFNHSQEVITQVPSKVGQVFIESHQVPNQEQVSKNIMDTPVEPTAYSEESEGSINWKTGFLTIYGVISLLLLIRLMISLFTIYRLSKNPKVESEGTPFFVVGNQNFTGGSFFHFIFINQRYLNDPAFGIILSHEQTHQRLWHSLDIVFSELFCVLFWINPITWIIKQEVRLNAEYEADHYSAIGFGKVHYANVLLNLSIPSQNTGPMLSFSALHTRKRLKKILEEKKQSWFTSMALTPFLFFAIWLVSCEPEIMDFAAMDPKGALKNVKTVTTRYISHQKDTQQKDGKIIAVAYYLPDGMIDRVEQHMTYPYDFEKPFERIFLTTPNPVGVLHILDGFGIGEATNNILYGNDWPKYNKIDLFRVQSELYIIKNTTIDKNEEGLPIKFILTEELNEDIFYQGKKRTQKGSVIMTLIEEFKYDDGKVLYHTRNHEKPKSDMIYKNQKVNVGGSRLLHETNYKYEGENLVEVSGRPGNGSPTTTKMEYENGIMKSSSYYRNDKKYHYREFFYNQSGLKTRTEIYNVYGEPEYTIVYDYEYY